MTAALYLAAAPAVGINIPRVRLQGAAAQSGG